MINLQNYTIFYYILKIKGWGGARELGIHPCKALMIALVGH